MGVLLVLVRWTRAQMEQFTNARRATKNRNRERGTNGPLSPANVQVPDSWKSHTPVTRELRSAGPCHPRT